MSPYQLIAVVAQPQGYSRGSERLQILIANNSLLGLRAALRIEDPVAGLQAIEVRNNLVLAASGPDLVHVGKDRQALRGWRFAHNWRESPQPRSEEEKQAWLPPTAQDRFQSRIDGLSRDPKAPEFLRPAPNS